MSLKKLEHCICCGTKSSDSIFLFEKKGAYYYKCNNCTLVYQNPQPIYELTEDIYDGLHYHSRYIQEKKIYVKGAQIYLDEIENYIKNNNYKLPGKKLLDVGCGIGHFLNLSRNIGYNVLGADISEWSAKCAKDLYNVNVLAGNFLDMNFDENTFDIITMWQTIEHLPEPRQFLNKIHKILKKDGLICIATPDVNTRSSRIYKKYWNNILPNEHIGLFNKYSIDYILNSTGFKPLLIETIRDRKFFREQFTYLQLLVIRIIKNLVLKIKFLKFLVPKKLLSAWENQSDLEIPLPTLNYALFSISKKL